MGEPVRGPTFDAEPASDPVRGPTGAALPSAGSGGTHADNNLGPGGRGLSSTLIVIRFSPILNVSSRGISVSPTLHGEVAFGPLLKTFNSLKGCATMPSPSNCLATSARVKSAGNPRTIAVTGVVALMHSLGSRSPFWQ